MLHLPADVSADAPSSPRLRKRLRWAGLFALLTLVLLWLAWWQIAEHQLAKRLAEIRAAGEPIDPQDFAQPQLPPEENAATYYVRAFAAASFTARAPTGYAYFPDTGFPPNSPAWRQSVSTALKANGPALAAARSATAIKNARWDYLPTDAQYQLMTGQRNLVSLLADGALEAHYEGDDAQAIDRILDLMHLCDSLGQGFGSRFTAGGAEVLALERLEILLPVLELNPSQSPAKSSRTVDRRQLEQLIGLLLDEDAARRQISQAIFLQRVENLETVNESRRRSTLLRPMYTVEMARVADQTPTVRRAFDQPDLVHAEASLAPICAPAFSFATINEPDRYSRSISWEFAQRAVYHVRAEFKARVERRAAAMAIAVQLYHLDRQRWPAGALDLVPTYLPAIPLNPLVPGGAQIEYRLLQRGGRERPMLYFITKEGAPIEPPPDELSFASTQYFAEWPMSPAPGVQWRDLSAWSPLATTQPTTRK